MSELKMLWDNPTLDGIAATHGSPLKKTHNESVSTDLHVLSRGFIPGEFWSTHCRDCAK